LGNCQIYIADWTDTSISLLVGLPQSALNSQQVPLSPFTDMGPQTFFQQTPVSTCPVAAGDNINVMVTNPQSGNSTSLPILNPAPVYSLSTTCPLAPPGTACPF
jgi:hypothetical protein